MSGHGQAINTEVYNYRSDSYSAFSLGTGEDDPLLSRIKKNCIATTYASKDPRQHVFEIKKAKIARTKHTTDSTAGLRDMLTNYLGRLEEFSSLEPLLF